MENWPDRIFDLMFIPEINEKMDELKGLAEEENWDYQQTESKHHLPILYNYIQYTYKRLSEENKMVISENGQNLTFNTGLVTQNQEPIFDFVMPTEMKKPASLGFFRVGKEKENMI